MRVLVAFDKFKDSLSAREACETAGEALRVGQPKWELDLCPLSDGGEGFADILTRSAGGEMRHDTVAGPRGDPRDAAYGLVALDRIPAAARSQLHLPPTASGTVALIEMAAASGLALLAPERRDVWQTGTSGTGELMVAAAQARAAAIVLGVGGSATNDLGLGALSRLGLQCRSRDHAVIDSPVPARWQDIVRLSGELIPLPPIFIACDVTNPLLGPRGAAAVYGPQKGLLPSDVNRLDHEAARLALLLCSHFHRPDALMEQPGAGAAGGIAFGLMVATGAHLLPGSDFVARWLDLARRVSDADVVITGEGRFDDSSLGGKGPGAIAKQAVEQSKRVHVFAGAVTTRGPTPQLALHAISPSGANLEQALRETRQNLARAVRDVFTR